MPRANIVFSIVAPLVLMAIIAVIVIGIGEALLATHHWAHHVYHVGEWPTDAENKYWKEISALPAVGVALAISTFVLIGGSLASWLAPRPTHQPTRH